MWIPCGYRVVTVWLPCGYRVLSQLYRLVQRFAMWSHLLHTGSKAKKKHCNGDNIDLSPKTFLLRFSRFSATDCNLYDKDNGGQCFSSDCGCELPPYILVLKLLKRLTLRAGVFLPSLVAVDDCRGEDGDLHRPLCIAWSSSARNHYIALVSIRSEWSGGGGGQGGGTQGRGLLHNPDMELILGYDLTRIFNIFSGGIF